MFGPYVHIFYLPLTSIPLQLPTKMLKSKKDYVFWKCANFYSFRLGLMLYYYIVPLKFNVYKNHHLILQYESIRFIVKLYQKIATMGHFETKRCNQNVIILVL